MLNRANKNTRLVNYGHILAITLGTGSGNEGRCYIVTSLLIGWVYTQNDPWDFMQTTSRWWVILIGYGLMKHHIGLLWRNTHWSLLSMWSRLSLMRKWIPIVPFNLANNQIALLSWWGSKWVACARFSDMKCVERVSMFVFKRWKRWNIIWMQTIYPSFHCFIFNSSLMC